MVSTFTILIVLMFNQIVVGMGYLDLDDFGPHELNRFI